jgi:hypothetical protein
MRMIVDAFKDTLELGLEKPKQVVVRFCLVGTNPRIYETWIAPMRPLRAPLFPPCDGPGSAGLTGSTTSYLCIGIRT